MIIVVINMYTNNNNPLYSLSQEFILKYNDKSERRENNLVVIK